MASGASQRMRGPGGLPPHRRPVLRTRSGLQGGRGRPPGRLPRGPGRSNRLSPSNAASARGRPQPLQRGSHESSSLHHPGARGRSRLRLPKPTSESRPTTTEPAASLLQHRINGAARRWHRPAAGQCSDLTTSALNIARASSLVRTRILAGLALGKMRLRRAQAIQRRPPAAHYSLWDRQATCRSMPRPSTILKRTISQRSCRPRWQTLRMRFGNSSGGIDPDLHQLAPPLLSVAMRISWSLFQKARSRRFLPGSFRRFTSVGGIAEAPSPGRRYRRRKKENGRAEALRPPLRCFSPIAFHPSAMVAPCASWAGSLFRALVSIVSAAG